ncbi:MAG: hypothetical protein ACXWKG_18970, partial [Limisphaerales bacterium]
MAALSRATGRCDNLREIDTSRPRDQNQRLDSPAIAPPPKQTMEGKLFHPLAFTKTFAMAGSTLLAVTIVP